MSLLQITSHSAEILGWGRTWARSLGKAQPGAQTQSLLDLGYSASSPVTSSSSAVLPSADSDPPPTWLHRHRATASKEHLALPRAWEDAERSHTFQCDAPGGLSQGFQPYGTRTPMQPPRSSLPCSPVTPVWHWGSLVMLKGDSGKIKQRWGGGAGPEQGDGFEAKREPKEGVSFNSIFWGSFWSL